MTDLSNLKFNELFTPMMEVADRYLEALPRVPLNGLAVAIVIEAPTGIVYCWPDTNADSIQWTEWEGFLVPVTCRDDIVSAETIDELLAAVIYHDGMGFDTHTPSLDPDRNARYGRLPVLTTYGTGWLVWSGDHNDLATQPDSR
jgi:hypothetical protein